jgi:hypothetical protein
MDTNDEEKKKYYLTEHARQIKQHINSLYNKKYWENLESSANFVILFLPGECFLSAALEVNPSMIEYASKYNIILATPTTMIALLKTISYGWENIHISKDIDKIKMTIQNLYSYLHSLIGDMNSMGKSLNTMNILYKNANNTLNYHIKEILEEVNSKYSVSLKNTPFIPEDSTVIKEKKNGNPKEKNLIDPLLLKEQPIIERQIIESLKSTMHHETPLPPVLIPIENLKDNTSEMHQENTDYIQNPQEIIVKNPITPLLEENNKQLNSINFPFAPEKELFFTAIF